uniref:Uncharacterized protein n=1 Tax=Leersia perrieri TaxID=77586 RepID=A0A0D9VAP9_9ORYZ
MVIAGGSKMKEEEQMTTATAARLTDDEMAFLEMVPLCSFTEFLTGSGVYSPRLCNNGGNMVSSVLDFRSKN